MKYGRIVLSFETNRELIPQVWLDKICVMNIKRHVLSEICHLLARLGFSKHNVTSPGLLLSSYLFYHGKEPQSNGTQRFLLLVFCLHSGVSYFHGYNLVESLGLFTSPKHSSSTESSVHYLIICCFLSIPFLSPCPLLWDEVTVIPCPLITSWKYWFCLIYITFINFRFLVLVCSLYSLR